MGGYWIDSPDNPFNQMSYTRRGGGYDNRDTHESNDRRAHAMQGSGAGALPHFATAEIAQAYYPGKGYAVVDDRVIRTTGPGAASASTQGGSGGSGAGSGRVTTNGPASGGAGAGSRLTLGMPTDLWWEEAGELSVPAGTKVSTSKLPDLEAVLKGTNTAIMIGGVPFVPHPGTSNAEEIEALMGEGDSPLEPAWYMKWGANLTHIDHNIKLWANDPATRQWAEDFDRAVWPW